MTSSFKGSIHNILLRQKVPFSCSVKIIDCSKSDPLTLLRLENLAAIAKAHKSLVYSNFLKLPEWQCENINTLYFVSINENAELCGVAHCTKENEGIYIEYLVSRSWRGATTEDQKKFAGTGTRLLDAVVLYARLNGYKYLKLQDGTDVTKQDFYNNYGFTVINLPQSNASYKDEKKYYVVPSIGDNEVEGLFHRLNDIKKTEDVAALKKYLPKVFEIKDIPIGPNPFDHTIEYTFDATHPFEPKWSYPAMKHVVFNDPSHSRLYADTFPELESLTFYGEVLRSREEYRNTINFSKLKGLRIEGELSSPLNALIFPALKTLHIGEKASASRGAVTINKDSNKFNNVTMLSITTKDFFYDPYLENKEIFPNVIHLSLLGAFNSFVPVGIKVKHLILGPKYNKKFKPGTFVNGPVEIKLTGDYPVTTFNGYFDNLPVGSTVKLNDNLIYPMDRKLTKRKLQN